MFDVSLSEMRRIRLHSSSPFDSTIFFLWFIQISIPSPLSTKVSYFDWFSQRETFGYIRIRRSCARILRARRSWTERYFFFFNKSYVRFKRGRNYKRIIFFFFPRIQISSSGFFHCFRENIWIARASRRKWRGTRGFEIHPLKYGRPIFSVTSPRVGF